MAGEQPHDDDAPPDAEMAAWLAQRAEEARARRRQRLAELQADLERPGVAPAGPDEPPISSWMDMYGGDGEASPGGERPDQV